MTNQELIHRLLHLEEQVGKLLDANGTQEIVNEANKKWLLALQKYDVSVSGQLNKLTERVEALERKARLLMHERGVC